MAENRLQELLAGSIRDVFVQETQERIENVVEDFIPTTNGTDFHEPPMEPVPMYEPKQAPIIESEYTEEDAESNAVSLVNGLGLLTTMVIAPVSIYKVRKKAGGKKIFAKMQKAYEKKMNGETLNETEQNLLLAMAEYERKLEMLSDSYLMTPKEKESLMIAAKHYCQDSEIKIGAGLGFWSEFAGITVGKVLKIIAS